LNLYFASQALAAIRGRNYVIPDDVKHLAIPVLAHRTIVKAETGIRGQSAESIIKEIVDTVPVPVEETT
jgi:MoxR-like ATPase